jgi:cytochrome c553
MYAPDEASLGHRFPRGALAAFAVVLLLPMVGAARSWGGDAVAEKGTAAGAPPCVSCHGARGEGQVSPAGAVPRLAGLDRAYIAKQLDDYREGRRRSDIMQPVAEALRPAETAEVARYYSEIEAPPLPAPLAAAEIVAKGERLAALGKWEANLPPCLSCHGPQGVGVAPSFPYISGQPADYIAAQLRAWQSGQRQNDPLDLMKTMAHGLDDKEIAAIAAYFQSLAPPKHQGVL